MVGEFSEDEEIAFVAEQGSSGESREDGNSEDMDLANAIVTSSCPLEEKKLPLLRPDKSQYVPQEHRPLILFDLNGVLVHHHFDGKTHVHVLRPGLKNLVRLKQYYDLGIYSSATERTVKFAMNKIEKGLGLFDSRNQRNQANVPFKNSLNLLSIQGLPEYLPEKACRELLSPFGAIKHFSLIDRDTIKGVSQGEGVLLYENPEVTEVALVHLNGLKVGDSTLRVERRYEQLFDVVLHREHCILASDVGLSREDGKPWDTVKPLDKYFRNHRGGVVLIDDSSHKSWPGEENSMVILPTWSNDTEPHIEEANCMVLEKLADIFMRDNNVCPASFRQMVDLARKEFSGEQIIDIEIPISESDSAEMLPVFTDRGESPKPMHNLLSPLHYEVKQFALEATPSDHEVRKIEILVRKIESIAKSIWAESKTFLFGSYAQGLSLPGSDLDITILGVGPNISSSASGFSQREKSQIKNLLFDLLEKLMEANIVHSSAEIIQARIPVLKFNAHLPEEQELIPVDISFGTKNGLDAVQFIRANIISLPALRPIVLLLKAVLKESNMNEVFTGGLGSYALVNIVLAHMQMNGYWAICPKDLMKKGNEKVQRVESFWESITSQVTDQNFNWSPHDIHNLENGNMNSSSYNQATFHFVSKISQHSEESMEKEGCDLGILLWGFLDFFGSKLDFYNMAISVLKGGITTKSHSFRKGTPWLLAVEDPQDTTHDICCRTLDIHMIRQKFEFLSQQLVEYCDIDPEQQAPRHPKPLSEGSFLNGIIDLTLALDRGQDGIQSRKQNDRIKAEKIKEIYGSTSNSTKFWVGSTKNRLSKTSTNLGVNSKPLKKKSKTRCSYYAVIRGRTPGIYRSYNDCLAQVHCFKGNQFKGFETFADAKSYLKENGLNNFKVELTVGSEKDEAPNPRENIVSNKKYKKRSGKGRSGSKSSKAVHSEWVGANRRKGQHFHAD